MEITAQDALIIVDVQNDFCSGSLAVKEANDIITLINQLTAKIKTHIFTRDFHPKNHCSFDKTPKFIDKSWPAHCVQGTYGVEYHAELNIPDDSLQILKGQAAEKEEYSGFENPQLMAFLRSKPEITRLLIVGLATDYCVCETAKAAAKEGFKVIVIDDACKAVNVPHGSVAAKYREMQVEGIKFVNSPEITNLDTT